MCLFSWLQMTPYHTHTPWNPIQSGSVHLYQLIPINLESHPSHIYIHIYLVSVWVLLSTSLLIQVEGACTVWWPISTELPITVLHKPGLFAAIWFTVSTTCLTWMHVTIINYTVVWIVSISALLLSSSISCYCWWWFLPEGSNYYRFFTSKGILKATFLKGMDK